MTDVDLRSTERTDTEEILPDQMTRGENDELDTDNKTSPGERYYRNRSIRE